MSEFMQYSEEWKTEMKKLPKQTIIEIASVMGIEKQNEINGLKERLKKNWIKVEDCFPENIEAILVKPQDDLSPERTKKLIVLTEMGTVSDNFRLKMATGEKEWVWFMNYEGDEQITHWMIFEEPNN